MKIQVVKNQPKTLTSADIHSFLGLAGYAPLRALTKNKVKFEWVDTCDKSFQELKERLSYALVHTLPMCGDN